MLDRNKIIQQAYDECLKEMYKKAQPSVDLEQLMKDLKDGKIDEKEVPIYQRYYLSQKEFEYIRDKYIDAYCLKEHWIPNIETLEEYLIKGGTKDKWIERDGAGYRGYEKVAPIKNQIIEILNDQLETGNRSEILCDKITSVIMNTISDCKNFYKFDKEKSDFICSITLGASPTSNSQDVIDYWKSQGIDIKIEERNPLLFWEMDYYGENFEEVMETEYGKDWKTIWKYKLKNE